MVALRGQEIDRFLLGPQPEVSVWLIHGADQGLVDERVRAIANIAVDDPSDPLQVINVESDQIPSGRLFEEWAAASLFVRRRLLKVDLGSRDIIDAIQHCLNFPAKDCTLVLRAAQLRKDAAVRVLCEKNRRAVAVECYSDSAATIRQIALEELTTKGFSVSDDALGALAESLGADRSMTRSEIAKLATYMAGSRHIGLENVQAIVAGATARPTDAIVGATISGDLSRTAREFTRAVSNQADGQAVLSACLRLYLQISRAKGELQNDRGRGSAPDKLLRGSGAMRANIELAFAREDVTSSQTNVEILREASARARRDPSLSEIAAERAVWSVALRASRRGGR